MTTTETETPTVHIGQTWKRVGNSVRHVVVAKIAITGITYVAHRYERAADNEPPYLTPFAEFIADFEDPEWSAPAPETDERYSAMWVDPLTDGGPYERSGRETLADAIEDGMGLPDHVRFVGVLRVTITRTYEWVRAGESEDGE